MTAIRPVQIACDGTEPNCWTADDVMEGRGGPSDSIAAVRAQLREDGWTTRGGKDFCPECRRRRQPA